jgi:hypothetical protein
LDALEENGVIDKDAEANRDYNTVKKKLIKEHEKA